MSPQQTSTGRRDGLGSSAEAASLSKTQNQTALWIQRGFADSPSARSSSAALQGEAKKRARSVGVPK